MSRGFYCLSWKKGRDGTPARGAFSHTTNSASVSAQQNEAHSSAPSYMDPDIQWLQRAYLSGAPPPQATAAH